jgi:HrpA-like RNA helicase
VHEEDRDTEFLLVALRELVARRREAYDASPETAPPPLKLVLMSATLGLQKLGDYFGGCPSCSMGGTNFPVTTFFLEDVLKQTK